jgi:hypothetical protein
MEWVMAAASSARLKRLPLGAVIAIPILQITVKRKYNQNDTLNYYNKMMTHKGSYNYPFSSLVIVGLLALLFFMLIGPSYFMRGIPGIALAATSGFGIGLISTVTQRTRPSRLWAADLIGSIIGLIITIYYVREISLQEHPFYNQWVLFTLPIAATMGSVFASNMVVREFIDNIFSELNELK